MEELIRAVKLGGSLLTMPWNSPHSGGIHSLEGYGPGKE